MLTPLKSSSFVRRKFKMGANAAGSLSINIAPVSSRSVEILPLSKLEKKESGIHMSVCFEVLNLVPPTLSCTHPGCCRPLLPLPLLLPLRRLRPRHRGRGGGRGACLANVPVPRLSVAPAPAAACVSRLVCALPR